MRYMTVVMLLAMFGFVKAEDSIDAKIAPLIKALGDETFETRSKASAALRSLGKDAVPVLQRVANSDVDPEIRHQAGEIIEKIQWGAVEKLVDLWQEPWKDDLESEPIEIKNDLLQKFFPEYRFFHKRFEPWTPGMYSVNYAVRKFSSDPERVKEMNSHLPPGSNYNKLSGAGKEIRSACTQLVKMTTETKLLTSEDAINFVEAIQPLMWTMYAIEPGKAEMKDSRWQVSLGDSLWTVTVDKNGRPTALEWDTRPAKK
jgi:hypothetical protein